MRIHLFILALLHCLCVRVWELWAQESGWQQGTIVTTNSDTLSGSLNLDLSKDILQFSKGQVLQAFTPRQVVSFNFYDQANSAKRFFVSLPFKLQSGYAPPAFFEVLYMADTIGLLCRQGVISELTPVFDPFTGRTNYINRQRQQIDFYFSWKNGPVKAYDGKVKRLSALFGSYSSQMRKYIKSRNGSINNITELTNLILYYQKLVNESQIKN